MKPSDTVYVGNLTAHKSRFCAPFYYEEMTVEEALEVAYPCGNCITEADLQEYEDAIEDVHD